MNLFNIFSAESEYTALLKDKFDRNLGAECGHEVFEPRVSQHLFKAGFKPVYPGEKHFAVCVSHDLDRLLVNARSLNAPPYRGGIMSSLSVLKHEITSKFKKGKSVLKPAFDPVHIIGQANKYGFRSTYFMLALKPGEQDFNYPLEEVKQVIETIKKTGAEIQLHGGHKAYRSTEKIAQEKSYFEKHIGPAAGYRNHYLRFTVPDTWHRLSEAGFKYDSTFGFHDMAGFRNGMCYPHFPYDLRSNRYLPIIEVPLIVMDSSLFKYMNLDDENAFRLVTHLIDRTAEVNGVFTFLWHNLLFSGKELLFFQKVMDYLQRKDPWYATTGEVVRHYEQEGYLDRIKDMVQDLKKQVAKEG
jgi:hypothetical protein